MAVSNILLQLSSLIIEFVPAVVFNPLTGEMHGIHHVYFFLLIGVDFLHEGLFSGKVLDSLVGSLFFYLEFKDSCIEELLLCEYLFLLINRLHHVSCGLTAND
jgi:hypothetical protein